MKNNKINFALISATIAIGTYFVVDAVRSAKDKIFRLAAGESNYERNHKRK
jgi:hypothetical protein